MQSKGVSGLAKMGNPFKKQGNKESSKEEFKKLDVNNDKTLSKNELKVYIESHADLWALLGQQLNLSIKRCIEIATDVAFQLATNLREEKKRKKVLNENELSKEEFTYFHKKYVLDEKGSQDFFLRTIFAAFDLNGDGTSN